MAQTASWKAKCKEIWQDEDGWWATLKDGYAWGIDDNTVFNGESYEDLVKAAKEIHKKTSPPKRGIR